MAILYILACLAVLLVLIVYYVRTSQFQREYGDFDPGRLSHVNSEDTLPRMKTGDLVLFRHRTSIGAVLKLAMTPFSHGGMIVMRDGVPHVAEATYWPSIRRDRLKGYHPRDRYGTTVFPLRDRLEYYPGDVYWAPLEKPLTPDQEARILRAANNDGEFYTLRPWRSIGVPNFHCFEYVVYLFDSGGLLGRQFHRVLRSGEEITRAVLRGGDLLCGNAFGALVILKICDTS